LAKRKVYSDKFKASAVLMLEAAGYPDRQEALTTVSEHLVMSAKTLASWYEDTQSPDPIEPISKITEIYSEEQTASVQSDDLDWMFDDQLQFETSDNLDAPRIHERRETQRIFVNGLKKEALNKLVPILPPPGSDMYIVSNGAGAEKKWKPGGLDNEAFDFGTFIPHLVDLFAERGCIGYISTWTMNRNHALNLIEMLDDGRFAQLTVFTDPYFQRREPAVAATLIDGLMRHRQTYKAFKNHCKIVAIATADEHKTCTVVSSANLSAQPRCEQYVLTTAPDVYSFYKREFFETMLNGKN
jgi:hypothetical protein